MKTALIMFMLFLPGLFCTRGEDVSHSNYLIFGHFHGECRGEQCVEIFRLEEGKLWEDRKDSYPENTYYTGHYQRLGQEKYELAKDIRDHFPVGLLNEPIIVGQPDAGDWGGLYIEYNYNGVRKFWLLDKKKDNVPLQYHAFIDSVVQKIALLH